MVYLIPHDQSDDRDDELVAARKRIVDLEDMIRDFQEALASEMPEDYAYTYVDDNATCFAGDFEVNRKELLRRAKEMVGE